MQEDLLDRLSKFVIGSEGNTSFKCDDGFYIKESGTELIDNSLIKCDLGGNWSGWNGKPSIEVSFHSFIYRNSPYQFIVHTHPINTLKILCSDRFTEDFAKKRLFPDQVVFNDPTSCVIVPYATPGIKLTEAIMRVTERLPSFPELLLLKNHGIICCANSFKRAVVMTEICEKAAEIFLGCSRPNFLSLPDIIEIQCNEDEQYRKKI